MIVVGRKGKMNMRPFVLLFLKIINNKWTQKRINKKINIHSLTFPFH